MRPLISFAISLFFRYSPCKTVGLSMKPCEKIFYKQNLREGEF